MDKNPGQNPHNLPEISWYDRILAKDFEVFNIEHQLFNNFVKLNWLLELLVNSFSDGSFKEVVEELLLPKALLCAFILIKHIS